MAQFGLVITRQTAPGSTFALVIGRQSGAARQCLHMQRDAAGATRQCLHLQRDVALDAARQTLHLLYAGRDSAETRQCLHLRRRTAPAPRQELRLWLNAAYAPRQCLHLLREDLPLPRQCLRLLRDGLPIVRQCLHLQRDDCPATRQGLHLLRDGLPVVRQCVHLQWDACPATRQGLHLLRNELPVIRQCLHLLRDERPIARQCLHLQWDACPATRQCLNLLRDGLPAARQCLRLRRDICPATRQCLHLIRDALPVVRQCLHLKRDKYPLTRRCLHLLRNAEHAVVPAETSVAIDGVPVYPIAIRVTESADQAAITATLEFAEALPPGLGPPASVVIEIFGIRYELLGKSYSRSREFGSRSWTLTASSPAYRLQSRYAADIEGELVGMASAIARELANGIPMDWRMVDWQVLPGRLAPTKQAPLDVLRDLVSAAGGRLTSARDGSLTARPWPPQSPAEWAGFVRAETDSLSAMISISDDADERDLRNAVTVSDESATGDLRIEDIPDTRIGGRAEVRVYQVPWQDDFDVRHTAANWALLQDLGVEERTVEDEMLEIVDGQGRAQYPIYELVAVRWNKIDLGAITHDEDGTITTEIPAESLLYLTYKTKARRLLVDMREANPEPIMIVAED